MTNNVVRVPREATLSMEKTHVFNVEVNPCVACKLLVNEWRLNLVNVIFVTH